MQIITLSTRSGRINILLLRSKRNNFEYNLTEHNFFWITKFYYFSIIVHIQRTSRHSSTKNIFLSWIYTSSSCRIKTYFAILPSQIKHVSNSLAFRQSRISCIINGISVRKILKKLRNLQNFLGNFLFLLNTKYHSRNSIIGIKQHHKKNTKNNHHNQQFHQRKSFFCLHRHHSK